MVQILPYVPSFLEQLTPHIKQATSDIATTLEQRSALKGLKSLMNASQNAPQEQAGAQEAVQGQPGVNTTSPLDTVQAFKLAEKALGPQGAKVFVDSLLQQQKLKDKEAAEIRKEDRAILAAQPKKYLEDVENFRANERNIDLALNAELDAIYSGETDPFSKGHISEILKQFNLPPALAAPLETVGSKEFRTGQKTFLTNTFKDAFRGATTQGQIELASSLLAEAGAKREANLASIYLLQAQHMIQKEKRRLTDEAIEEGISPQKIPRYVDKKLDSYAKYVNDQYFIEMQNLRKEAKK